MRGLDLSFEAGDVFRFRGIHGVEELHRDAFARGKVPRQPDLAHAAFTDEAEEFEWGLSHGCASRLLNLKDRHRQHSKIVTVETGSVVHNKLQLSR